MALPDDGDDDAVEARSLSSAHAELEALVATMGQEPLPETFAKIRSTALALAELACAADQSLAEGDDRSVIELYAQAAELLAALPDDPLAAQPVLRTGFALAERARRGSSSAPGGRSSNRG